MSLPQYKQYRDSGIEWIGTIPSSWSVSRLGFECDTVVPMRDKPDRLDGDIPWIRIEDFDGKYIFTSKSQQAVSQETVDSMNLKVLPKGTVLCSCSCNMGATAIVQAPMVTNQTFIGIVPGTAYLPEYLYYFFLSAAEYLNSMGTGAIQTYLSQDDFRQLRLPLPTLHEQAHVARFLEEETAKIDALVLQQERLIALLEEKLDAAVLNAVTRGLNPNAPTKDSGGVWLRKVPEHWRVLKGSQIGHLFGSPAIGEEEVHEEGVLPFIKVGSLSSEQFTVAKWVWHVSEAVASRCTAHRDFIVFPKRGAAIFMNKVNIVDRPALIDPNLMGWKIGGMASTRFMAYVLKARKLSELADVSTVPQINNKHIEPEKFPVPPLPEQDSIVAFLDHACSRLKSLTAEATLAISLLKERRTALITAAVTGQIDVRGAVQSLGIGSEKQAVPA